jgi:hypothetical protein
MWSNGWLFFIAAAGFAFAVVALAIGKLCQVTVQGNFIPYAMAWIAVVLPVACTALQLRHLSRW